MDYWRVTETANNSVIFFFLKESCCTLPSLSPGFLPLLLLPVGHCFWLKMKTIQPHNPSPISTHLQPIIRSLLLLLPVGVLIGFSWRWEALETHLSACPCCWHCVIGCLVKGMGSSQTFSHPTPSRRTPIPTSFLPVCCCQWGVPGLGVTAGINNNNLIRSTQALFRNFDMLTNEAVLGFISSVTFAGDAIDPG